MRENFLAQIYPFQQFQGNFPSSQGVLLWHKNQSCSKLSEIIHFTNFWATLVVVAEKPPPRMRENFLIPDLSISGNFEQLWFLRQKSPPPPPPQDEGKFFGTRSIHFRQFQANLVFVAEKPPPHSQDEVKFSWHQIYPFQAILSNFSFCWQKSPPPFIMRENYLTSDLSISGNFWATLVFCGRKAPPLPRMRENFLDTRSIHFRQFRATLVFVAEKLPPSTHRWGKFFWHQIYPIQAILSNFGFCGRKAPLPHSQDEGKCFDTRSIHFRQFWATLVLWQNSSPPQDEGNFFDTRSIQFRQFWATLVFVAEKPPPPGWGKIFWHRSIHFSNFREIFPHLRGCFSATKIRVARNCLKLFISGNFWATLVFVAEKPPPPFIMRENFLTSDLSISGNFEQLWFLWQKSPPPLPGWGKIFWHQIYPFQAILSNFGFCGRIVPPPPTDEGNFFDTRSIQFRQFWATLVFVAEKPRPPPHSQDEGNFFDTRSIHFRQFWATLVFVAEKHPLPFIMRENFLTSDLSISGNFEQLWFLWQKSPPPTP